MQKIYLVLLIVLVSSCAKICTVSSTQVTLDSGQIVHIGESQFPCKKQADFQLASQYTIEALFSIEFEQKLKEHLTNGIGNGAHAAAWEGLEAKTIIKNMRMQINGTYAETYGGIKGWWLYKIYGNRAFDGTEDGPIKFNRIPLKNSEVYEIANTIAHEVAHRIGLVHPSSNKDLEIAFKEPPYVIGFLIRDIVKSKME